jgi:hypothetical protein
MVIVVPALTHCQQRRKRHVEALHGCAVDMPVTVARVVGEIADKPVAQYGYAHPAANAPEHPSPSADRKKQQRPWQLLQHPVAFHESMHAVIGDLRFNAYPRRTVESN